MRKESTQSLNHDVITKTQKKEVHKVQCQERTQLLFPKVTLVIIFCKKLNVFFDLYTPRPYNEVQRLCERRHVSQR